MSQWLSDQEIGTFQDLMVLSSLRGRTGSGIAIVPQAKKKAVELLRSDASASEHVYSPMFNQKLKEAGTISTLMGHARYPTRGGVTMADVHPHYVGDIIGMHNGTMSVVDGTVVGKEDNDSRMIFESINREGFEKAVLKMSGEFALSWLDLKDSSLHFYRNIKRPLWFAGHTGGWNTVWWASEASFLYCALERTYGDETMDVVDLKPYHHVVFDMRAKSGKVLPTRYENITFPTKGNALPAVQDNLAINTVAEPSNVRYVTYKGQTLFAEELALVLSKGCAWCSHPKEMSDYTQCKIKWVSQAEFFCKECAESDFAAQYAEAVNHPTNIAH
jgi:hypothetical protein